MLQKFLKKAILDFNYKSYLIIKLQLLLIVMLFFAILRGFVPFEAFLAVEIALTLVFLWILLKEVRKEFAKDFKAYFLFFFVLLVLVQGVWNISSFNDIWMQLNIFFGFVAFLLIFLVFFRFVLGRNYCVGKVMLSDEKNAMVETDFDLLSFTKAGKYAVKTNRKYEKGAKVKVKISRGFLGAKPSEIIGAAE